jgi:hypothetical protein
LSTWLKSWFFLPWRNGDEVVREVDEQVDAGPVDEPVRLLRHLVTSIAKSVIWNKKQKFLVKIKSKS